MSAAPTVSAPAASSTWPECSMFRFPIFRGDGRLHQRPVAKPTEQGCRPKPLALKLDPMAKRETLELVRAYYRIADPRVRKRIFDLAKSLAKAGLGS